MTLTPFHCPHCHGTFQFDTAPAAVQVACPHCRQMIAMFGEPAVVEPPVVEPPVAESPLREPPRDEPPVTERSALDPDDALTNPLRPGAAAERGQAVAHGYQYRRLAVNERATRRFLKNAIVWVCCAIVLVSILAFFLLRDRPPL